MSTERGAHNNHRAARRETIRACHGHDQLRQTLRHDRLLQRQTSVRSCIYTPKERSAAGVKGINTEMLVDYILNTLGQETWALDKPPLILVVDRARIHNEEKVMEAFRERGGHVTQLLKMPPMAAKRLSPLDNALFHDWKKQYESMALSPFATWNKSWPMNGIISRQTRSQHITSIVASLATRTCMRTAQLLPLTSMAVEQTYAMLSEAHFLIEHSSFPDNQVAAADNFITRALLATDKNVNRIVPLSLFVRDVEPPKLVLHKF
jgi:hypothetical protein